MAKAQREKWEEEKEFGKIQKSEKGWGGGEAEHLS